MAVSVCRIIGYTGHKVISFNQFCFCFQPILGDDLLHTWNLTPTFGTQPCRYVGYKDRR